MNLFLNCDRIEGMKKLKKEIVDFIVTSPPYNVGKNYGKGHDDGMNYDDYLKFLNVIRGKKRKRIS